MQRVIAYIDGFNLYYGLRAAGWRRYYRLDLRRLAENLLRPGQTLATVRYFSARVQREPAAPTSLRNQQGGWLGVQSSRPLFCPASRRRSSHRLRRGLTACWPLAPLW